MTKHHLSGNAISAVCLTAMVSGAAWAAPEPAKTSVNASAAAIATQSVPEGNPGTPHWTAQANVPRTNAQRDNAQQDNGQSPDIIVTAQSRKERLIDVPLAIQAFTGRELENTGVRRVADLINQIPGASEGRGNAAGIQTYQIRGVSSFYGDSTIGYYIDEAAYVVPNRNYAPVVRAFDLDRVEVLRGPQGTLYGLGSMGGTIRFITAEPDLDDFHVRGLFSGAVADGARDSLSGDLAVSIPIVPGRFAIRGSASREHQGGFAESPSFPGDKNDAYFQDYRVKLLAQPIDAVTIKLGYQRNITEDHWGRNFAVTDPPAFPVSPVTGRSRQVYDMYTGFVGLDLGVASLESSTGYIERKDASAGPIILGPRGFELDALANSKSLTEEVRLISKGDTALRYVVGGVYAEAKNLEDIAVVRGPPISSVSTYDSKSYAVFGEVSYGLFGDKLRPLVGLRYFEDKRDFTTQNRLPFLQPQLAKRGDFHSLNPRFNLSFRPNPTAMFYFNAARGFRSGTFNTAAAVAASGGQVDYTVNPDSIWSYEVGSKLTLADRKLYLEASLYHFDWNNVQLNYSIAGGVQVIRNAGAISSDGIDYGITWHPLRALTLQATGNFNKTKFASIVNPAGFVATPNIAVGRQVASVPENHHTFAATYAAPVGAELTLYANASYTFISKQGDPGDNFARFGVSHDLLKARVGVNWRHFGVSLFGDNLLNDNGPIQVSGSGSTRYYPRRIGFELKVDY